MKIVSDTAGLPAGYISLASLGVPPSPCTEICDDYALTYILRRRLPTMAFPTTA